MIERVKEHIKRLGPQLVEWRRHLHMHPELSFQEHATAEFVAGILRNRGIEIRTGAGRISPGRPGTGVIALVHGEASSSDGCFALRADLDALPIHEIEGRPWRSRNDGVMHACGHDAHTSMVLGAGLALHELRQEWSGTLMLVFQPGEEKEPGGARLLLDEGALADPRPAGILGQHVTPELPVGVVGFRSGPFMASADEIRMRVVGKGGHAAMPHELIDPVPIAAQVVLALQQLVSRKARPGEPTVLSIGRMIADGATNVVPDEVYLEGTLRTFNEEWRGALHQAIAEVASGVARAMGATVDLDLRKGSPPVVNHPKLTGDVREAAVEFLGSGHVIDVDPRMGAEDFAWYSQVMPACFYRLGTGSSTVVGSTTGLHRSGFDIDERALEIGAGLMAWAALKELGR